jgi:hypothetical protein
MALVFDCLYAAPTTWLDNVDNVKVQPTDAADATRPDIWRYEGLRWASSVGPAGEPGIDLMDAYKAGGSFDTDGIDDWRFARLFISNIGDVSALGGNVWDATQGRFVQRHFISGDVPLDAYGLSGAGYDAFQLYSGDQRTDLGYVLSTRLYDPTNANTNFRVFVDGGGFDETADIPFSTIAGRWIELDTRWQVSSTTSSADGWATVNMRHSADGTTWTDLGEICGFTGANMATNPACYRSGSITYGMTICIGDIGIPGKFYYAKLWDSSTPEEEGEDEEITGVLNTSVGPVTLVATADVPWPERLGVLNSTLGPVVLHGTNAEFRPAFLGAFGPLIWIEFDDPTDDTIHVFSTTQLNDPPDYYHGPKKGTILRMERVTRALSSDDDGSIEGQRWGATLADTSRYWRGILGQEDFTRLILNRNVRLRMISNAGRLALEVPRTVALGLVQSYGAG